MVTLTAKSIYAAHHSTKINYHDDKIVITSGASTFFRYLNIATADRPVADLRREIVGIADVEPLMAAQNDLELDAYQIDAAGTSVDCSDAHEAHPAWVIFRQVAMNRDRGLVGNLPLLHDGVALQPEDPSATTPLIGDVHAHNRAVQIGLEKRSILFHLKRDHEFFDSNRPRIIHTFEPSYFVDRVSLTSPLRWSTAQRFSAAVLKKPIDNLRRRIP